MSNSSRIEVVLHGASNSIGSHSHPVLESGGLAFPMGKYHIVFGQNGSAAEFELTHQLDGVPLLTRLIEEGKAQYACIVSSPRSAHREVHLSPEPCQTISCSAENFGEPPLFTPAVLCVEGGEVLLSSARDGIHKIWDEQRVSLSVGARLAVGNVIQLEASITQLLSLHADENMEKGGFAVEIQSEPFGFRANLHPELHQFLRFGRSEVHHHLMTHIVTACLARLKEEYPDNEELDDIDDDGYGEGPRWESHSSLRALAALLADRDLPHWTDDTFRPEFVATRLYPLPVPTVAAEDET